MKKEVLEQKLIDDKSFQHILKFAPQSQRELMTFELAKYFHKEIVKAREQEHSYFLGLAAGVSIFNGRIADTLVSGIKRRKEQLSLKDTKDK